MTEGVSTYPIPIKFPIVQYIKQHPNTVGKNSVRKALVIAIIYKRKKIISYGFNRRVMTTSKNSPINRYSKTFTIHAEDSAIRKAGSRTKGADIMVIRLRKDGSFGNAKPCFDCQYLIDKAGINKRDWTR